jgi:hypothetical protein
MLGRATTDDPLLPLGIALEGDGLYQAAMDVLAGRWLLLRTDPSGPWNCVATARQAGAELLPPLLQALTAFALADTPSTAAQDDEWLGNALALAIDGFLEHGAIVCASVAAQSITDADDRQDALERIHAAMSL